MTPIGIRFVFHRKYHLKLWLYLLYVKVVSTAQVRFFLSSNIVFSPFKKRVAPCERTLNTKDAAIKINKIGIAQLTAI